MSEDAIQYFALYFSVFAVVFGFSYRRRIIDHFKRKVKSRDIEHRRGEVRKRIKYANDEDVIFFLCKEIWENDRTRKSLQEVGIDGKFQDIDSAILSEQYYFGLKKYFGEDFLKHMEDDNLRLFEVILRHYAEGRIEAYDGDEARQLLKENSKIKLSDGGYEKSPQVGIDHIIRAIEDVLKSKRVRKTYDNMHSANPVGHAGPVSLFEYAVTQTITDYRNQYGLVNSWGFEAARYSPYWAWGGRSKKFDLYSDETRDKIKAELKEIDDLRANNRGIPGWQKL